MAGQLVNRRPTAACPKNLVAQGCTKSLISAAERMLHRFAAEAEKSHEIRFLRRHARGRKHFPACRRGDGTPQTDHPHAAAGRSPFVGKGGTLAGQQVIRIPDKTIESFYQGRISGPSGAAAKDVANPFPARRRRGGAVRRDKKLDSSFLSGNRINGCPSGKDHSQVK